MEACVFSQNVEFYFVPSEFLKGFFFKFSKIFLSENQFGKQFLQFPHFITVLSNGLFIIFLPELNDFSSFNGGLLEIAQLKSFANCHLKIQVTVRNAFLKESLGLSRRFVWENHLWLGIRNLQCFRKRN